MDKQEDIIDAKKNCRNYWKKKISEAFGYKKYNRYYRLKNGYNNYLMANLRKMDDELKIKRILDDI